MRAEFFASGSSGNCTLVSACGQHVLVDAGISMRRIKTNLSLSGLKPEDISGILITHEHADHINGLPMLTKYYNIPIYAPRTVANHLKYAIAGVERSIREISVGKPFSIGCMNVLAFSTPHDTDESVGYRIECGAVFALATDMGHVTDDIERGLAGADCVLIEANHDPDMLRSGPYPYSLKRRILSPNGHLSNGDCALLAARLVSSGTEYIVLGHISRENNTPETACRAVREAICGTGALLAAAPAAERLTIEFERTRECSV